jgi:hypothetical protein
MTKELEIRAQIDTENVKALLLINGGGAVALLAFLPSVLGKPEFAPLMRGILYSLILYQFGLLSAIVHNRLRRKCSLVFQTHRYRPPPCSFLGFKLKEPCICSVSILFMWASVIFFVVAGFLVFWGGIAVLSA